VACYALTAVDLHVRGCKNRPSEDGGPSGWIIRAWSDRLNDVLEEDSPVRVRVQVRLAELRQELERGQAELEQVERRTVYLREMLLRIGGAAQVLEELLAEPASADPDRPAAAPTAEPQTEPQLTVDRLNAASP
jgi:hypothetical protein